MATLSCIILTYIVLKGFLYLWLIHMYALSLDLQINDTKAHKLSHISVILMLLAKLP